MTARNRELLGLLTVSLLVGVGFATVSIRRGGVVSAGFVECMVLFVVVYLGAHAVTRLTVPRADPHLLPLAALLSGVGLTEIYRLEPRDALRQGIWITVGVVGFAVALVLLRHDYRRLQQGKYLIGLGAIGLLMLPAVPGLGATVNGARLWVRLGPLELQPGEFAKIAMIVFLAAYLRDKREVLAQGRLKDFGPLAVVWGTALLVLFVTNDVGMAVIYFGVFLAMLYVATARIGYVISGVVLFGAAGGLGYLTKAQVRERIVIWLHPWTSTPVYCPFNGHLALRQDCQSYQLVKSLYSIGNGHFGGTGLGNGTFATAGGQPLIPYLQSDFIYSALAQELGLIGVSGLLLVYMLFVLRGFRIAVQATDGFSKLLATGLAFSIALQTFSIVGGILRVIPLTGITLPFISYGGSSIVANFLLLAGLLLVSHRADSALLPAVGPTTVGRAGSKRHFASRRVTGPGIVQPAGSPAVVRLRGLTGRAG